MLSKARQRATDLRKNNLKIYIRILDDFCYKIKKQGCGCNVENYGAAYYNNHTKTFDPIGLSLGFEAIRKHFGLISDDEQRPLVQKMSRKYKVNCETDKEYTEFVNFLQHSQDIHDFSFDQYYSVENDRMDDYFEKINNYKKELCTSLLGME